MAYQQLTKVYKLMLILYSAPEDALSSSTASQQCNTITTIYPFKIGKFLLLFWFWLTYIYSLRTPNKNLKQVVIAVRQNKQVFEYINICPFRLIKSIPQNPCDLIITCIQYKQ